jgi:hypothetical protein
VADALIYLCCSEDSLGHAFVIEGMDKLQKFRQQSMRFEGWMQVFEATILGRGRVRSSISSASSSTSGRNIPIHDDRKNHTDKELLDYALSNIMLVNALIEIPDELELRIHLRNQLNLCGLSKILKVNSQIKFLPANLTLWFSYWKNLVMI